MKLMIVTLILALNFSCAHRTCDKKKGCPLDHKNKVHKDCPHAKADAEHPCPHSK